MSIREGVAVDAEQADGLTNSADRGRAAYTRGAPA